MTAAARRLCAASLLVLSGAACRSAPADAPAVIRVAYSGVFDFDDVPSLVANDRLAAEGIRVEIARYRTAELVGDALVRGEIDVGIGSNRTFWTLAARGAPIRTVLDHAANVHRLVARSTLANCRALSGLPVGLNSEGSAGTALARRFFAESCPDARPQILMLPQSNNRIVALESGSLAAAVLKLAEAVEVQRHAPGGFYVMGDFFARWPSIETAGVNVNMTFARAHEALVTEYVRAQLLANRDMLADRAHLIREAERRLGTATDWTPIADAYLALPAWQPDGGLSDAAIAESLAFYFPPGGATPTPRVTDVADASFVRAALANAGEYAARTPTGDRPSP
jgi:ABC-type nitrate/sulfonate/bicarbonate transport system substrate-binding protein